MKLILQLIAGNKAQEQKQQMVSEKICQSEINVSI